MSINMNEGRNKKLLVPVIALMLCATALIGAGYAAYVSSAKNTENAIGGDAIELTLTGTDETSTAGAIARGVIKEVDFGQVAINDKSAFYVKENIIVGAGNLKIDLSSFKKDSINLDSINLTAEAISTEALANYFTFEIKITKINDEAKDLTITESVMEVNKPTGDDKTVNCEFEVWIKFKAAENPIPDVTIPVENCVQTDVKLDDINAGFTYSVAFKAQPTESTP